MTAQEPLIKKKPEAYIGFLGAQCYLQLGKAAEAMTMLRLAWLHLLLNVNEYETSDTDLQNKLHNYLSGFEGEKDIPFQLRDSLHTEAAELLYPDLALAENRAAVIGIDYDEAELFYNQSIDRLKGFSDSPELQFVGDIKKFYHFQLAFYQKRNEFYTEKHGCDFAAFELRIGIEHKHSPEDDKDVWDWNEVIDEINHYQKLLANGL